MLGAGASIGRYSVWGILPRPSIGLPSASMTRPMYLSPTGMPAVFPVRLTVLPCTTRSPSPNKMQPTRLRSNSCTIPRIPESKRRISPYAAFSSPETIAIPSATESTSPVSSARAAGVHSLSASAIRGMTERSSASAFLSLLRYASNCAKRPISLQSYTCAPTSSRKPFLSV